MELVFIQALRAESSSAAGQRLFTGYFLWDLQNYYEHLSRSKLWDRAGEMGFSLAILAVALNQYGARRFIGLGALTLECQHALRGIAAGCGLATTLVQVYASPPSLHEASVNAVAWAPHEHGLALACASSDGSVSVLTHRPDGSWEAAKIPNAHSIGCTGVSWSPAPPPGSLVAGGVANVTAVKRLVTSGCDNLAKIWRHDGTTGAWQEEHVLRAHGDWVRDACWSVNMGLPMNTVATCGQDGLVFIWTQDEPGGAWSKTLLHDFKVPVWRLSWSVMGNVLAVSDANNLVTVWKESVDGKWDQISAAE